MAMRLSSNCCSFLADLPVLSKWQTRSLRRLIAVVLLLAGLSKIVAALAGGGVLFDFALAGWELLLSGWLLCEKQPVWSLAAGAFTFSAFVGVSLQRLMLGSQACDCFGDLRISPQWTLVGDVAVVVLLAWAIRSNCQAVVSPFLIALILFGCSAGMLVDSVRLAADRSQVSLAEAFGRRSQAFGIDGLAGADDAFVVEAMNAMLLPEVVAGLDSQGAAVPQIEPLLSSHAFRSALSSDLIVPGELAQVSPVGILVHRDGRRWVVTGVVRGERGAAVEVARNEYEVTAVPVSEIGLGDLASLRVPSAAGEGLARPVRVGASQLRFDRIWHNCGNIGSAATAEVRFRMRNDGVTPISVAKLIPSCGCLRFTPLEGKSIQPGEATTLAITVARGAGRSFSHSLRLELLGTSVAMVRLRIFGRQDQGMIVTPSLVDFGVIGRQAVREVRVIRLAETASDRFQVVRVHLSEILQQQGEIEQTRSADGLRSYIIRLTVLTASVLDGRNEGIIEIETTSRARPTVAIPFQVVRRFVPATSIR